MKEKIKKWMPSRRKLMQLYFALLFNANIRGFVSGNIYQGASKKVCVPGMNCYSCPGAVGACPLGSLQGSFQAGHSTVFYVCGILLLYGLLFGRMICGWLCPFGLVQDLFYKIKTPKLKKSPVTRVLSYLKYVLLTVFALIIPITYAFRDYPLPAFCKYICPAGTFEGGLGLLANKVNESYLSMLGPLFTWKFLLMVSILVGCIFVFRLFCRFICPIGAIYSLFNRVSVFGVRVDAQKCTDCGLCVSHCKVDIKKVGDQECISCGECVEVCPVQAISWKGPKLLKKPFEATDPQKKKSQLVTRIITALVMVAVLVGAVTYYWIDTKPQPSTKPEDLQGELNYGNEPGALCYGMDLEVVDETGVTDQTINPAQTGKITIINFWGTWCSPCVAELPDFEKIAQEYPDTVTVVAIHSAASKETAPEFIQEHYPDASLIFSQDAGEGFSGEYYTMLGGRGPYPYTIIVDEQGVISQVYVSSVKYETLKAAVEALLQD